jgi:tetratricopeptide (TPR) repeat protein
LTRSAEKAERREGFREAARFYERALELIGPEHAERELELRLRRCETLVGLGDLTPAHEQLVDVAERARELERLDVRCGALLRLANVEFKRGLATAARGRLEEAQQLASTTGDRRLQVRALFELAALSSWFEGDTDAAVERLSRALELAEEDADRDHRIEGHLRLATTLFNAGRLAEAESQVEGCLALTTETGSVRDDARATSMLSLYRYYRGDVDDAERLALQAVDWLDRTGDTFLGVQNLRELARCAIVRGSFDEAEARLREAIPLALEIGGWLVIEIYRYLAETLVRQGRIEEASELVGFAARNVPEEDPYARAALRIAEGIVETALGEGIGATRSFTEATTILEEQELRTDLGEARIQLARALRQFGDVVAARAELERARNIFAPMDAGGPLAEIERELADLGVGAGATGPHATPS